MEAITNPRIRLNFKDPTILNKTQKKLGLKHSWLLLKPHHITINDVVSYIIDEFDLRNSCPYGITLTMDDFVLPPFESTIIFKDKDLVSVKRKKLGVKAIIDEGPFIEHEIVEKQQLPSVVKRLANEDLDKEIIGYKNGISMVEVESKELVENDGGGDVALKKRKPSSPMEISKKKRPRQALPKSVQKKDINHFENNNVGGNKAEVNVKSTDNSEPKSESNELDEKKEVTVHASGAPEGAKKASRSSRRKKLQRQWRKLRGTNNNEEVEKKDVGEVSEIMKILDQAEEDSDEDGDLVPVEIRPGYIRFTSASKAKDIQKGQEENGWDAQLTKKSASVEDSSQKNVWDSNKDKVAKETYNWNGITNKKKGQKWGKDNQPSWNESRGNNGESSNSRAFSNQPNSSWKQTNQNSNTWASKRKSGNDSSIDFEKLLPLIDSPKVGDVVAYRLLELSSSWCPVLSSFRVGKITSFDQETNKIVLVQEAQYPLNIEKKEDNDRVDEDDSVGLPQPSVYNEDGSLEIDFPSLVDVRIVKTATPSHLGVPTENGTCSSLETGKSADKVEDGSKNGPSNAGSQELHTPTNPGSGKKDVWEEISEALSAKKAQLLQEDTWNKKPSSSSTRRSWSHRTLKSSALGPTMAMLRSQNGV